MFGKSDSCVSRGTDASCCIVGICLVQGSWFNSGLFIFRQNLDGAKHGELISSHWLCPPVFCVHLFLGDSLWRSGSNLGLLPAWRGQKHYPWFLNIQGGVEPSVAIETKHFSQVLQPFTSEDEVWPPFLAESVPPQPVASFSQGCITVLSRDSQR